MLLGNMGLSNMLTGIAVVFGHFYPSKTDTICAIQMGMFFSFLFLSNNSLAHSLEIVKRIRRFFNVISTTFNDLALTCVLIDKHQWKTMHD
jgi:Na+/phosphate symporter